MSSNDSQIFESYLPIYDAVPEEWKDARPFLVENLKKISNAVNIREIGWFLDEELISGKQYLPGSQDVQEFRTILRKVIVFTILNIGLNTQAHGISVTANFTLIQLFGSATNAVTLTGESIPNSADSMSYDATNIYITAAKAYTRGVAVIEYIQEL